MDGTLTGNVLTADDLTSIVGSNYSFPSGVLVTSNNDIIINNTCNLYIKYNGTNTLVNLAGAFDTKGYADGNGTNALFGSIESMTIDSNNNIYILENTSTFSVVVRKVDLSGNVTTIAGDPNFTFYFDGNGTNAKFCLPIH